ncbi:MAG: dTDP-4-dehydrorhamnose 3,5-epimerase [Gemmatimonadaceae bacterium]|nr:dTDP-4-dehydrorhamnose 3,5-epimerase [Gemmatimonadaceae bacterium]
MTVEPTSLPGVVIVTSPVYHDERGSFAEVFHAARFANASLPTAFVQDNHSHSTRHVLRGLHYQVGTPQGKLVRAVTGTIFDVAVDLRRASPTFGQWFGTTLSEGDGRQLWIPEGCAHGFLVLSASANVSYKCTALYDARLERALHWNDETIGVRWPIPLGNAPVVSEKDARAPMFSDAVVFA